MEATPLAGVNLAIWYGFGLIVAALVLALIYGWVRALGPASVDRQRLTTPGRPAVTHDSSTLAIAGVSGVRRGDARHQFLSGQAGASRRPDISRPTGRFPGS